MDEITNFIGLMVSSLVTVFTVKWYLQSLQVKRELERLKNDQLQKAVQDKKAEIHNHTNSLSDDELSKSSSKLYDKLDGGKS